MTETVCITGGSGGIGQALLEQLSENYKVKALFRSRTAISTRWEARGCIPIWGDLGNDEALAELVSGTRYVFHCAGLIGGSHAASFATNVSGTERLARAAAAHGCQRLVHLSSVAVYSNSTGRVDHTEDAPLRPDDEMAVYSLTKLQSERVLEDVAKEGGLEFTTLRPTCVYGPETKPYTLIPLELMRRGLPVMVGDGTGLLDAVYVDDVATAMILAAGSPQANGEVFNIGHQAKTFNEFYSCYSRMLNRPARHLPLPLLRSLSRLLQLAPAGRAPKLCELRRGARFMAEMAANATSYPSAKAARMLGYAPRVTLPIGMLKTELWARARGLVPRGRRSLVGYGPLRFEPAAVVHPSTEDEIAQVAITASRSKMTARAIGSLHSLCPIPETDGICVVLDNYNQLLKVDGALVTVQAGMKLRDLNDKLAELGLALPVHGSIAEQTVAGAISTATHGGSLRYGSLADCVESIRIVRADGRAVDVDRSQELLHGVVVTMGLLGITSTVTLRCVPAFALQSRSFALDTADFIDRFDRINRQHLYTDVLYHPIIDTVEVLAIDPVHDADLAGMPGFVAARPQGARVEPGAARRLAIAGLKASAWIVLRNRALQARLTRRSVGSHYQPRVGRSDLVLAFGDQAAAVRSPGTIRDMEVAIRYEAGPEAIRLLRSHFAATRDYPLLPIHIRCSARSTLWLSPAYQRDVCWLEFWQYPAAGTLFRDVHRLLEPFQYRFHWGKEAQADPKYIRQRYEKWDEFVQLRARWDPDGVFLNRYLASFFDTRADVAREVSEPSATADDRTGRASDIGHAREAAG